jgi:hypothetical protein
MQKNHTGMLPWLAFKATKYRNVILSIAAPPLTLPADQHAVHHSGCRLQRQNAPVLAPPAM